MKKVAGIGDDTPPIGTSENVIDSACLVIDFSTNLPKKVVHGNIDASIYRRGKQMKMVRHQDQSMNSEARSDCLSRKNFEKNIPDIFDWDVKPFFVI